MTYDPFPPEEGVLFSLTVYKDGTVSVWSSKNVSDEDFGAAIIAVGEAFAAGAVDMVAGGDLP